MWITLVPHAFTYSFKILVIDITYFLFDVRPRKTLVEVRQRIGPEEVAMSLTLRAMDKISKAMTES